MTPEAPADNDVLLILDASVLINFLRLDKVELLASLESELWVTDHVEAENTEHYT